MLSGRQSVAPPSLRLLPAAVSDVGQRVGRRAGAALAHYWVRAWQSLAEARGEPIKLDGSLCVLCAQLSC